MDDEPNLDNSSPPKMELSPAIHLLPNELLAKIIEQLPRTQWPAMELVDTKFRDAVLLAWRDVRDVDIERDFIYSERKAINAENNDDYRRHIARDTDAILKKLFERSPLITSLIGLPLMTEDSSALNTTAVRILAAFKRLETIKFAAKYFWCPGGFDGNEFGIRCGIPLISFIEFIERTRSRGTLKVIDILQSINQQPASVANIDRLRAAFATVYRLRRQHRRRQLQMLQLESFPMRIFGPNPLTFFDTDITIDTSRMTKLNLMYSDAEPTVLTNLINRAPRLQHLDFAFLQPCGATCQSQYRQPNKDLLVALESLRELTSLGFNSIWVPNENGCTCHRFEAVFMKMLRTIGPKLVNFVFESSFLPTAITMGHIRDIIRRDMTNLKSIQLSEYCAKFPEELRGIADGKQLEAITIAPFHDSINDDEYMGNLNDVLSTIIVQSPRLKRFIGVDYCPNPLVAIELFKLGGLINLRINAGQLSVENFVDCSQVFAGKLRVLHLDEIGEGVESGLIELLEEAIELRELTVVGNVTDRLLECLASSCPNLEKFVIEASEITIGGVRMLVDSCPKLRCLCHTR